jgi:hypothetical protein
MRWTLSAHLEFFCFHIRTSSFNTAITESKCGTPARIRPYPTGRLLLGRPFPGTSCQATIALSLRDKSRMQTSALYRTRPPSFRVIPSPNPQSAKSGFRHRRITSFQVRGSRWLFHNAGRPGFHRAMSTRNGSSIPSERRRADPNSPPA